MVSRAELCQHYPVISESVGVWQWSLEQNVVLTLSLLTQHIVSNCVGVSVKCFLPELLLPAAWSERRGTEVG